MKRKPARKTVAKVKKKKVNHKYIFVVGGVMSGVGKGVATSSLGTILQAKGYKVNLVKADPYLNVDAGNMSPTEHGEVFVLNSGLETDQDMGNYERFLNQDLSNDDYMTSGMVYKHVIDKERSLGYGGKFVDADHIREEIVRRIKHAAVINKSDISIIEIGGTVGDYQNIMFIEAARVLKFRNPGDVQFIMVSYLPIPGKIGEMKSKPTQNAVKDLNSHGVQADFIIARSEFPIDTKRKEKIAFTCNVHPENVISAPDIDSIYDVPLNFERGNIGNILLKALNLETKKSSSGLNEWKKFAQGVKNQSEEVNIAIVGKYFNTGDFVLTDAYLSVLEAIKYSCCANKVKPRIHTVNARDFEVRNPDYSILDRYDGILVPGGFGETGIEGKLNVIHYARENQIPYFGICYGMQLMTIEYARNVLGLSGAHTAEIDPKSPHLIIDIMPDQKKKIAEGNYGGSMRLGLYPAKLAKGTIAQMAYGSSIIKERHRHRYEVNPKYIERIEKSGLIFSGKSPDGTLMEIAELPKESHPFFLGAQFHPEFLARPLRPHPLFNEFIKASKKNKKIAIVEGSMAMV
ncbi:MAG: CTP synthase [bacterium]|nr:CTP synthase [bacterium]